MDIHRLSTADQTLASVNAQQANAKLQSQAAAPKPVVVPPPPSSGIGVAAQQQVKPTETEQSNLKQAVEAINKFLKPVNSGIEFSIDEDSGRTLVKVIDIESKEVLRQFPSKEALAIAKELDKLQGLLIKDKA